MRTVYGNKDGTVWIDHDGVEHETDKAILFKIRGEEVWLPRSQIVDYGDEVVGIPQWLASKKKLEGDW